MHHSRLYSFRTTSPRSLPRPVVANELDRIWTLSSRASEFLRVSTPNFRRRRPQIDDRNLSSTLTPPRHRHYSNIFETVTWSLQAPSIISVAYLRPESGQSLTAASTTSESARKRLLLPANDACPRSDHGSWVIMPPLPANPD